MTRRTLVPMDGSAHSRRGLEHAFSEHGETEIVVFHVADPIDSANESTKKPELSDWRRWCDRATERANTVFADAQAIADGYGTEVSTATMTGRPKEAIVEYVTDHGVDHVVMGSRGRTDNPDISLGSVHETEGLVSQSEPRRGSDDVAETVLRRAPVLVTVVR